VLCKEIRKRKKKRNLGKKLIVEEGDDKGNEWVPTCIYYVGGTYWQWINWYDTCEVSTKIASSHCDALTGRLHQRPALPR